MFQGFSQQTIDFMWNIRFYNEKTWFEAHREEYRTVLAQPMKELAWDVYESFTAKYPEFALQPHVSRIYRDARRARGRGPYKDYLWFTLRRPAEDEWTDQPVFWFELAPETWSYGMGYYCAKPSTMARHRARIEQKPQALEKLARALQRQTEFVLEGETYARPKGDPGPLLFDWYNKKTFSLIHEEKTGAALFAPALAARLVEGFSFLAPYYRYFSTLDGDPEPKK